MGDANRGASEPGLLDAVVGDGRPLLQSRTHSKEQLLVAARTLQVEAGQDSPFGQKFEMRIPVTGPGGTRMVLAVWIREFGQAGPRLVTCYVE